MAPQESPLRVALAVSPALTLTPGNSHLLEGGTARAGVLGISFLRSQKVPGSPLKPPPSSVLSDLGGPTLGCIQTPPGQAARWVLHHRRAVLESTIRLPSLALHTAFQTLTSAPRATDCQGGCALPSSTLPGQPCQPPRVTVGRDGLLRPSLGMEGGVGPLGPL